MKIAVRCNLYYVFESYTKQYHNSKRIERVFSTTDAVHISTHFSFVGRPSPDLVVESSEGDKGLLIPAKSESKPKTGGLFVGCV